MNTVTAKGQETRLRIIRAAADLFHKQGIRVTSPDEIIEASGTGKGQFYHYFKNKDGLVHEVLLWHIDTIKSGTSPINYDIKTWDDLENWFRTHIEMQKSFAMTRGCPFGTAANEVTEEQELLRRDLDAIFRIIKERIALFFRNEKALRRLNAEADEDELADFCIATIQGAMLLAKVQGDSRPAEATIEQALKHLRRYANDLLSR